MTELQILLNRKKETIKIKAEINKMENGKKKLIKINATKTVTF